MGRARLLGSPSSSTSPRWTPHNLVLHHCSLPRAEQPSAGTCQTFSPTRPLSGWSPAVLSCKTPCSFKGERRPARTTTLSARTLSCARIADISSRSVTHRQGLCRWVADTVLAYILLVSRSCTSISYPRLLSTQPGHTDSTDLLGLLPSGEYSEGIHLSTSRQESTSECLTESQRSAFRSFELTKKVATRTLSQRTLPSFHRGASQVCHYTPRAIGVITGCAWASSLRNTYPAAAQLACW